MKAYFIFKDGELIGSPIGYKTEEEAQIDIEKTDENGQLIYGIHNLPYETKYVVGYHEDDAYYTRSSNVTRNVTRMGDFDLLQLLINAAGENGVVNLTRNYTYAEGFETSEYLYINYNNITISTLFL